MSEKIHVLADESMGGTKREYVEVDRKAEVGDMVVMPPNKYFTMYAYNDERGIGSFRSGDCEEFATTVHPDFIKALEPTDIVHIESDDSPGVRYELVDRKAEVGERVIIIKGGEHIGLTGEVTHVYVYGDGNISVDVGENFDYFPYLFLDEYRVLEPVESESSPKSIPVAPETFADIIANLVARVAELERREEAQRRLNGVLSQRIAAVSQRVDGTHRDVETWAQEIEKVRAELGDKIEMCIDDIAFLDERTQPKEITISVADLAKLIGGVKSE